VDKVHTFHWAIPSIPSVGMADLHKVIKSNVAQGATLYTDKWVAYRGLKAAFNHSTVDHGAKEYVNGDCAEFNVGGIATAECDCCDWELESFCSDGAC
jgi:hypothetical protein